MEVAASAITLASLAAGTCHALAELRAICKSLPGRLHALNNEVADLELVLFQVATTFRERSHHIPEDQAEAIPRLLDQATDKLIELKLSVERFAKACDRTKVSIIQANIWRREQPKLTAIQQVLKTIKCSLNIVLGASNSYETLFHIVF